MFDKERHHPLGEVDWSSESAYDAIDEILKDARSKFTPLDGWPLHPMDDSALRGSFYLGSGGVLWAIDWLDRQLGNIDELQVLPLIEDELKHLQKGLRFLPHQDGASYLFGPLPLMMLKYQLEPSIALSEEIFAEVSKNSTQPVRELMWGSAGSMLGTLFMHKWSEDSKWVELFQHQAGRLIDAMELDPDVGYLWNSELYGRKSKYLGPVHGFTGNLIPLIKGNEHLAKETYKEICQRSINICLQTAIENEHFVNWPATVVAEQRSSGIVQHCHGAAGMVTVLSELPEVSEKFQSTLEKASELVWHLGALKKGSNLCHGTGGNGFSFLKMYQRTGDEKWLQRARAFAMTGIDQTRSSTALYHQGRYTLWTGDIGFAIFLYNCINATADFPTIDVF